MSNDLHSINWGIIPYREAWELQQKYFDQLVEARANHQGHPNYSPYIRWAVMEKRLTCCSTRLTLNLRVPSLYR